MNVLKENMNEYECDSLPVISKNTLVNDNYDKRRDPVAKCSK